MQCTGLIYSLLCGLKALVCDCLINEIYKMIYIINICIIRCYYVEFFFKHRLVFSQIDLQTKKKELPLSSPKPRWRNW